VRKIFTYSDNPRTANSRCFRAVLHYEIYNVALPLIVVESWECVVSKRGEEQCGLQDFRIFCH